MANLWMWFPDAKERREYVIQLLGLESTKKEALALQEEYLAGLDAGKTYSPWFGLEGQFYMNMTEKLQWQHHPFLEYPVGKRGSGVFTPRRCYMLWKSAYPVVLSLLAPNSW